MSADGLATICASEECAGARVGLDLVRHEDGEIELFGLDERWSVAARVLHARNAALTMCLILSRWSPRAC